MLDHFYIATVYTALIVMLLSSATLFICRRSGDRSRIILSVLIFISVFNYLPKLLTVLSGTTNVQVMTVPMLALAIFMIISYLTYPIEVISPGWLNWRRLLLLYSPVLFIFVFYWITLLCGVEYKPYFNLIQMLSHIGSFDAALRILLCLLMFFPILIIFFIPYTRIYSNTDKTWVRVYAVLFVIDVMSYIMVLMIHGQTMVIIYFHISMLITLIRVYMELVYRIVDKKVSKEMLLSSDIAANIAPAAAGVEVPAANIQHNSIFSELEAYMSEHLAWRDPNMSLEMMTSNLCTNRTTLAKNMRECGEENFSVYVNKKRISDFISLVNKKQNISFKEAFFICGYRSRTTALRNFKSITGTTPSAYFGRTEDNAF